MSLIFPDFDVKSIFPPILARGLFPKLLEEALLLVSFADNFCNSLDPQNVGPDL